MGQKVAIYCRVSTADQSCARQEQDLLAYADRAGFEVVEIRREISSGTKDQRSERKKIMALAQDRRIDAILVTELTRWGRSTTDLVQTLQNLQAWNVSLIAQTGLQFDLSTPQGKLIASMMAAWQSSREICFGNGCGPASPRPRRGARPLGAGPVIAQRPTAWPPRCSASSKRADHIETSPRN